MQKIPVVVRESTSQFYLYLVLFLCSILLIGSRFIGRLVARFKVPKAQTSQEQEKETWLFARINRLVPKLNSLNASFPSEKLSELKHKLERNASFEHFYQGLSETVDAIHSEISKISKEQQAKLSSLASETSKKSELHQ